MEEKRQPPPQHQVFINFRGEQLRNNFIGHLMKALKGCGINVFIDTDERKGKDIKVLLKRIEESRVALAIFSTRYTESTWCLDELAKINERVDLGMLEVLPIFYKVPTESVKQLVGEFGDHFRRREWEYRSEQSKIDGWKKALVCVAGKIGLPLDEKSSESDFIVLIVTSVLELLAKVSSTEQIAKSQVNQLSGKGETSSTTWQSKYNIAKAPQEKLNPTQPRESVSFGARGGSLANPTNVSGLGNIPSGQHSINPSWLGPSSSFSGDLPRGNSLAANANPSRLGSQPLQGSNSYSITTPHHWTTSSTGTGPANGSTLGEPPMQGTYNMSQRAGSAYATGNTSVAQTNQLVSGVQRAQQPYSTVRSSPGPSGLLNNYNAQYGQGQVVYSSFTSFNGRPVSNSTYVWNLSPRTTMTPTTNFPPMKSSDDVSD